MILVHDAFREKEAGIYARSFDPANLAQKGIVPSPVLDKGQSGYLIALRHQPEIADAVAAFSDRIASRFPAVTYNADNIHTTVATFGIQEGFLTSDTGILHELIDRASRLCQAITLNYDFEGMSRWLANPDTVIAAGRSSDSFADLVSLITAKRSNTDVDLKPTWGSHITTARFTEARSPTDITDLTTLLKEGPSLGKPAARSLDVGYFLFDKAGFRYRVEESFTF